MAPIVFLACKAFWRKSFNQNILSRMDSNRDKVTLLESFFSLRKKVNGMARILPE